MEGGGVEALLDEAGLHVVAERVDGGEVEERLLVDAAVRVHDLDAPGALDHEDAAGAVAGIGDVDRIEEAVRDLDQGDVGIPWQITAGLGDLIGAGRDLAGERGGREGHRRSEGER